MTTSTNITLDGVKFKLSDELKKRFKIIYINNNIKDVKSILESCDYDFTKEKDVISTYEAKKKKEEEQKRKRDELKKAKLNVHETCINSSISTNKHSNQNANPTSVHNRSSTNPFLNDLMSNDILTPQKYTSVNKHDTSRNNSLDIDDFVDENLDPFSNAELQTIDDLKELKDVLQNVTMGGMPGTSSMSKTPPRVRHHSPTNEFSGISSKVLKHHKNVSENSKLDVCVSNGEVTMVVGRPSPVFLPANNELDVKTSQFPESNESTSLPFRAPTNLSTDNDSASHKKSSIITSSSAHLLSHLPTSNETKPIKFTPYENDEINSFNRGMSPSAVDTHSFVSSATSRTVDAPVSMDTSENYANLPQVKKKSPKPLPRTSASHKTSIVSSGGHSNHGNHKTSAVTSGGHSNDGNSTHDKNDSVQIKVLAKKSKADRAKFEETIHKALTSLPTLPKTVIPPKNPSSNKNSSVLNGLSASERDFARPIVGMGFKEEYVVKAMQRCKRDHHEILDYLNKFQGYFEKGFSSEKVEEACALFDSDEEKVEKYLTMQRQFLDMGFPSSKIKEALLHSDVDQNKALEELMSGV